MEEPLRAGKQESLQKLRSVISKIVEMSNKAEIKMDISVSRVQVVDGLKQSQVMGGRDWIPLERCQFT